VDKKQKRIAGQLQSQYGKSRDPDSPTESRDPDSKTEEEPESFSVDLHRPERTLRTGSNMHPREKTLFKQFLSGNADVFA